MDLNKPKSVIEFETLLVDRESSLRKSIYDHVDSVKSASNCGPRKIPTCTAKHVLNQLANDLKAIQTADYVRAGPSSRRKLLKYRKSHLVTLNSMIESCENTTEKDEFQINCVTDTQLIDIVEKTERNIRTDTEMIIDNEFDTSFPNEKQSNNVYEKSHCDNDNLASVQNKVNTAENVQSKSNDKTVQSLKMGKLLNENDNYTQLLNESMELDFETENLGFVLDRLSRSPSPILNLKTVKCASPLVYSLERFENFEKIAFIVLSNTGITDLNEATKLINTKLEEEKEKCSNSKVNNIFHDYENNNDSIEKEQHICKETKHLTPVLNEEITNVLLEEIELQNSPQINVCIDTDSHILSSPILPIKKEIDPREYEPIINDSIILKDEILFSSDEESDYINKDMQELPFTCALETSFYANTSEILDKTMYVGFQTASNKSIVITTDSFDRAKGFLSKIPIENQDQLSMSDLVEKCDVLSGFKKKNDAEFGKISGGCKENEVGIKKGIPEIVYSKNITEINDTGGNKKLDLRDDTIDTPVEEINAIDRISEIDEELFINNILNEDFVQSEHILEENIRSRLKQSNSCTSTNLQQNDVKKDLKEDFIESLELLSEKPEKDALAGFKTASNKNIQLSKKALESVKKVFQNINLFDNIGDLPNAEENERSIPKNIESKNSLSENRRTGDAIKKQILEQSIKNTKESAVDKDAIDIFDSTVQESDFFDDFNEEIVPQNKEFVENKSELENFNTEPNLKTLEFKGFQTASKKQIGFSKESLAKTKNIFQDILGLESVRNNEIESENKEKIKEHFKKPVLIPKRRIPIVKEILPKTQEDNFVGFKTASNNNIKISKASMSKVNTIFQDIDLHNDYTELTSENSNKTCNEDRNKKVEELKRSTRSSFNSNVVQDLKTDFTERRGFTGFKTASNNTIPISKKAFAKSRQILQDINLDENICEENSAKVSEDSSEKDFIGFKTPSNKHVNISKKALESVGKVFGNIAIETNPEIKEDNVSKAQNDKTNNDLPTFNTATNKNLLKPEESIKMPDNILQNINNIDISDVHDRQAFVGFKTANNKTITVSKEAQLRTKNLFQDLDQVPNDEPPSFVGFKTANNKKVCVSESAILKTKDLFKDNDLRNGFNETTKAEMSINDNALDNDDQVHILEGSEDKNELDTILINKTRQSPFVGFKTANNKKVNISENALKKTRDIFKDIDTASAITKSDMINNEHFLDINKRSQILVSSEHGNEINALSKEIHDTLPFVGFKTANDKRVNVSKNALKKTRQIFKDLNTETNVLPINDLKESNNIGFYGFKTASNKKPNISEEALAKSRGVFEQLNCDITENFNSNSEIILQPFKTGNNKNINTSRESLIKIKQTLKTNSSEINHKTIKHDKDVKTIENYEDPSKYFNTQLLHHFEEALSTEDFLHTSPRGNKRSASPILPCPTAKRRASFKTPYKVSKTIELAKKVIKIDQKEEIKLDFDIDYKKHKQYTLKDVVKLEKALSENNVVPNRESIDLNIENLLLYEFSKERNDLTNEKISLMDLKSLFLNSVNPKMVPENWYENHAKLVMWKFLSYEKIFPNALQNVCTVRNFVNQLKFRYNKELFNVERPAFRKIMEKDDAASKTMVVCVASVLVDGVSVASANHTSNAIELLLTDGWYYIKATIDKATVNMVQNGLVKVGTKLTVCGAELLNCEQGISPLEDTKNVRLKISTNSTSLSKWDAKLGFVRSAAILIPLTAVRLNGGKIGRLRAYVTRVYPTLYVEKFEDGSTVTRSERLENIHQLRYENERQAVMERLYDEVQREMEASDMESQDSESQTESQSKKRCLDSGSQIAKVMKRSKDPLEYRSTLTESQTRLYERYTEQNRERLVQRIKERLEEKLSRNMVKNTRNVVALQKVRVICVEKKNGETIVGKGLISIWRPNEAVTEMLKENIWIDVTNVIPTADRYKELHISANRQSTFKRIKIKENETLQPILGPYNRKTVLIKDIPNSAIEYNEIDTLGLVVSIDPSSIDFDKKSNKINFQNVYLADENQRIICLNFWGGLKKFGYENLFDLGQSIVGRNLQKRIGNTVKNIQQYRVTEFSTFSRTPIDGVTRDLFEQFNEFFKRKNVTQFCEECKDIIRSRNINKSRTDIENVSPYRAKFPNEISFKSNQQSPLLNDNSEFNISGLDFDSTFKMETQQLSDRAKEKKKVLEYKMRKLKAYGEPPPLSPIHIINKSVNATKQFKSPITNINCVSEQKTPTVVPKTTNLVDKQNSVASVENKVADLRNSVVVTTPSDLNRTYVKKYSVNPVKLNFSSDVVMNDTTDQFGDDFDCSPPLSLDKDDL